MVDQPCIYFFETSGTVQKNSNLVSMKETA